MNYMAQHKAIETPGWLALFPENWRNGDAIVVVTHALYVDGQNISVEISPSKDGTFSVSDAMLGWDVISSSLDEVLPRSGAWRAKAIAERTGVSYEGGAWVSRSVSMDQLPAAIMWVAHASQAWVAVMFAKAPMVTVEKLEEDLRERLVNRFGMSMVEADAKLLGDSSKEHTFSAVLHLPNGGIAAFTAVTPHGASVNSAYTKLKDVNTSDNPPAYLEVVVKNFAAWPAYDIALLRSAATSIVEIDGALDAHLAKMAALA